VNIRFSVDRIIIAYHQSACVLHYDNMTRTSSVRFTLLLLLWTSFDRCQSLFPYGVSQGDRYFTGDDVYDGPINVPYRIFNESTVYVSSDETSGISLTLI